MSVGGMNRTPPPTAEFEITPEDWEEVNAAHLFASSLFRDSAKNVRILTGLLFVTLALYTLLIGSSFLAMVFLVATPGAVAAMGPLIRSAQRNSLRKLSEQGISNGVFGSHRVEVREEGLWHATNAFESLLRWHAIDRVVETGGFFFVYTGPNAFLPIPVTAFRDVDSLRTFADTFHRRRAATPLGWSGSGGRLGVALTA